MENSIKIMIKINYLLKICTKDYRFERMTDLYKYLVSKMCRDENEYEFSRCATIKILTFQNNELKEEIIYNSYSDFCMHRKSSHRNFHMF